MMNMVFKYFILKMFNVGLILNTNANRSAQIKCSGDMGCGYMGGLGWWGVPPKVGKRLQGTGLFECLSHFLLRC